LSLFVVVVDGIRLSHFDGFFVQGTPPWIHDYEAIGGLHEPTHAVVAIIE
jgi:hypothetical protein